MRFVGTSESMEFMGWTTWTGMERLGNGASGKRCDIDGVTRTGELAGVSESSRDIDGKAGRSIERERKNQARRVSDFTRSRNDSRGPNILTIGKCPATVPRSNAQC